MKKAVVYTAISGGYDRLKPQHVQSIETDFICFTDDPDLAAVSPWGVARIEGLPAGLHPRMTAKLFKLKPHEWRLLDNYEYTIWVDGSITITDADFVANAIAAINESGWAMYPHPTRDCIYEEAECSRTMEKYRSQRIDSQARAYRAEGFPAHHGLWACGVIARKASDQRVRSLGEKWWDENYHWTYQDQLSLPVVLWRHNWAVDPLPGGLWDGRAMLVKDHERND